MTLADYLFAGRSFRVALLGDCNPFAVTQVMIRTQPQLIKQGKIYWAFAVCVLMLSASSSFGQYVSVIQGCTGDVMKFCAAGQRGADPLAECVKAHFDNFSQPCKAALVRIASVREACEVDIQKHCPTAEPGAGRILLCVKQHFAAMSEQCKEAIGHAAERKARAHRAETAP